jgi:hypothetical protein
MSPVYSILFVPPTYISAPEEESFNENTGLIRLPCLTSDANSGSAPKFETEGKANPNRPSTCPFSCTGEVYDVAAPKV